MIRALLWKEWREQGLIVGALAVLGTAVLAAIGILNSTNRDPFDTRTLLTDPGVLAVVMLTVTAGSVVGGTLFAAEKENGTDGLLALLPVRRRAIWAGKMLAGAGLVLGVTAALFVVAAPIGVLGPPETLAVWAICMVALALATFAWGSVGSALTGSSLAAAGTGVGLMAVATVILLPLSAGAYFALAPRLPGWVPGGVRGSAESVIVAALLFALLAMPVFFSLRLYTRPDRDRLRRAVEGPARGRSTAPRRPSPIAWVGQLGRGFRAALWMSLRQQWRFTLVLAAVGLVSGLSMLAPQAPFVAVWPPVGLFLAVLVGVLGWYDEQASGAKRFWLERRLPVARLWWAKVLVGAAATLTVAAVTLLPVAVKAWVVRREWDARPSYLMGGWEFPVVTFVLLWPAYGFAFGHLVGLLFRKAVVAVSVAVMVAVVAAGVWLPSLLGGGLHPWQVWAPVGGVMLLARTLAWACVADRVGNRRALGRLALGGVGVVLLTAAGLGYRVLEVSGGHVRKVDEVFKVEQIPPFETNLAGQEYRRAGVMLNQAVYGSGAFQDQLTRRLAPIPINAAQQADPLLALPKPLADLLDSTLEHGWRPSSDADQLLASAFSTDWAASVEAAAALPLGTVEDPRDLTLNTPLSRLHSLTGADALLLVRGLKAQHDGDPERFVADFALVLNLSRNVRNKSVQGCAMAGRRIEQRATQALPRWLERLHGRDDLLARVDALLAEHDTACGNDLADVRLADQLVMRNTLRAPGEVLRRQWRHGDAGLEAGQRMDVEADLVGLAWRMPWEEERQEQLLARGSAVGHGIGRGGSPFRGMPAVEGVPHYQSEWLTGRGGFDTLDKNTQADRRAARLMLALRRFELKHDRPPEVLAELVPEFLPAVPLDPFDGATFRYRLSRGERVLVETRTERPRPHMLYPHEVPFAAVAGGWVGAVKLRTGLSASTQVRSLDTPVELPPKTAGGVPGTPPRAVVADLSARVPEFGAALGGVIVADPRFHTDDEAGSSGTAVDVAVPPGRPVLWSVGADKLDNGGTNTGRRAFGGDRVYLPPPAPAE